MADLTTDEVALVKERSLPNTITWTGDSLNYMMVIVKFRARVSDITQPHHDDFYLCKWLRARGHNLDRAETMFRKSMAWRKEVGADTILETFQIPEVMQKYYFGGVCGEDKEGRPVSIDPLGKLDLKGILYSVKKKDIIRYVIWQCERVAQDYRRQSEKHGRRITQSIQIIDFEGFGRQHFWKPGLDLFTEMVTTVEDNYPETLHRTYFVNAPYMFHLVWSIVSPFIAVETRGKFRFLKGDWKKSISEDLNRPTVPAHWGGELMGPGNDPYCKHVIKMGGKVPDQYYQSKEDFFPKGADVKQVSISAGSTKILQYSVGPGETAIRYFFCTDHGDMLFGIYKKPENTVASDEVPIDKCEAIEAMTSYSVSKVPEDGLCLCSQGNYQLVFSNTASLSSRIWSNKITYFVEIMHEEKSYDEISGEINNVKNGTS